MNLQTITVRAPAKFNLTLEVGNRLANGYHKVFSTMLPISLADELKISAAKAEKSSCHLEVRLADNLPKELLTSLCSEDNLIIRAFESLRERIEAQSGAHLVNVDLYKATPLQAGLGGGSADAAAMLLGLNELLKLELSEEELLTIAGELGSDVPGVMCREPVFLYSRGEKLARFDEKSLYRWKKLLGSKGLVLLKPPDGVSTPDAYLSLNRPTEMNAVSCEVSEMMKGSKITEFFKQPSKSMNVLTFKVQDGTCGLLSVRDFVNNDFQIPISGLCSGVEKSLRILSDFSPEWVLMSGSGSCCLGCWSNFEEASKALEGIRNKIPDNWWLSQERFLFT